MPQPFAWEALGDSMLSTGAERRRKSALGAKVDRAPDSPRMIIEDDAARELRTPEPGAKILIVDDDEDVRQFVGSVLGLAGYRALLEEDGMAAMAVAENECPDAVILDLSLPGTSGLDVCSHLRNWFGGPILVLSGRGEESIIVEALERATDDYLKKPCGGMNSWRDSARFSDGQRVSVSRFDAGCWRHCDRYPPTQGNGAGEGRSPEPKRVRHRLLSR